MQRGDNGPRSASCSAWTPQKCPAAHLGVRLPRRARGYQECDCRKLRHGINSAPFERQYVRQDGVRLIVEIHEQCLLGSAF